MNKFLTVIGKSMLAFGLLLMYGCMSVEYVGQSFPALPENEPVKIYSPTAPFADSSWHVIGRVMITAPDGTTQEDVYEELTALAREHGAEAVNILDFKRVRIGTVSPESDQVHRVGWNRDGRNAGGAYIYSNYFGEVSTAALEGRRTNVTELQIKAVLLVSDAKFKDVQKLQKEQKRPPESEVPEKGEQTTEMTTGEALDKSAKNINVSPVKP